MKRFLTILSLTAICGFMAQGAPVSPDAALSRALKDTRLKARVQSASYTLAAVRQSEGKDAIYLFESASQPGFIVTSADDCLPAVLGFGDSKILDETGNFAPAFEYWLDFLGRRSTCALAHPEAVPPRREGEDEEYTEYDPIEPLCTTMWNQSTPYNDLCPEQGGRRSVTGCVATAMSQAMKYHNWPPTGEGYNEYNWQGTMLSMDYSAQTFDWSNMLDSYPMQFDGSAYYPADTAEQKKAVAQLMLAAGISVNMSYSPDASGAVSMYIGRALGQYFRYDKSLKYFMRDYFSLEDWQKLIHTSLKEYGPVIYDGQANIGGHSFICDGYLSEGYFHINWGWGGISDGWFLLDYLDPYQQGIGGADSGFNSMQDAIVGIRPDLTGTSEWDSIMVFNGPMTMTYTPLTRTITINTIMYNSGPANVEYGHVGVKFRDRDIVDGEPIYYVDGFEELPVAYGFRSIEFDIPELEDGHSYDVTPVYNFSADEESEYREVMTYPGTTRSYSFVYRGGRASGFRPTEEFKPSGVENISDEYMEDTYSTCEYYTASGVKIATVLRGEDRPELPAGIYLVRTGNKTTKVVIR